MVVGGYVLAPVAAAWYGDSQLGDYIRAYSFIPPLLVMSSTYTALLERRMAYKEVAALDAAGQLLYLCISIPIVLYYKSLWGLIGGALGQAALGLVGSARLSGARFHPAWDWKEARTQVKYGLGYATSTWIWEIRGLASPLVIGKLLGPEAVALIALSTKLITMMGAAKFAIYRVYMSLLARLAAIDPTRIKGAIESGLQLQVVVLGIPLIGFMAVGPEIVGSLLGAQWLPVLGIFPFIAIGQMVNAGFSLHSSALYVFGKNREVGLFHLLHVAIFIPATWCLTALLGSIAGYGWAEIAALVSYSSLRDAFRRQIAVIREGPIYGSMICAVAGMVVMAQIVEGPLAARLVTASLVVCGLLFAVERNRAVSAALVSSMVGRLRHSAQ
jgi:PST family polysaccharide transporter